MGWSTILPSLTTWNKRGRNAPAVSISILGTLPAATTGAAFGPYTLSGSGGVGPYTFALLAGGTPITGVSLSPSGVLSGTPSKSGGYNFAVQATDSNGAVGSATFSGSIASPVVPVPANLTLPSLSGTFQQGQVVSSTSGTWTGTPTGYSYQWYRGGTLITGANISSYTIVALDVGAKLTCSVIASNASGPSIVASSADSSAVLPLAPTNTTAPSINGTPQQGQTLTTSIGIWQNSPTGFAYQWSRGGVPISGATSSSYIPVSGDVGSTLTVTVTGSNSGGSTSVTTAATSTITSSSPSSTISPAITGSTVQGSVLTVSTGTWTGSPTSYVYQWKRGTTNVGTNANTYTTVSGDIGSNISCVVTATNAGGSASATAVAVGPITAVGSITTPVLARTSTAGAAPLTWTTTLNMSDTFAGDILRAQVATDSGFTAITQDIYHQLAPSEIESADINVSADGFLTPSGLYYLRARVERDDGTTSAWSTAMTDTITAASTLLTTSDGVNKSQYTTVSGSPALAFTGTASLGSSSFVRANANTAQSSFGFAIALNTLGVVAAGMDSNVTAIGPGIGVLPTIGTLSNNGVLINIYSAGCDIYSGGSAVQSPSVTWAAGDLLIIEGTKGSGSNGTISFYRKRSGTKTQVGTTITGLAVAKMTRAIMGTFENGGSGTANFGQTTLDLNTGFNPYG